MNTKVQVYRNKLGLTQAELAQKSGLSLRTVQRIESGMVPKGYTLKSIAKALEVDSNLLFEEQTQNVGSDLDLDRLKLINISTLAFMVLPFGNIIVPAILLHKQPEGSTRKIGRNLLSIQILWSLIISVLLSISPALQGILKTSIPVIFVNLFLLVFINLFIILRNAVELSRNGRPYIRLKYSLL
jgi:transcriptional regulator with XRE-family HTH domain